MGVEVVGDLQSLNAAGLALYITVPEDAFEVLDANPVAQGVQPFAPGAPEGRPLICRPRCDRLRRSQGRLSPCRSPACSGRQRMPVSVR